MFVLKRGCAAEKPKMSQRKGENKVGIGSKWLVSFVSSDTCSWVEAPTNLWSTIAWNGVGLSLSLSLSFFLCLRLSVGLSVSVCMSVCVCLSACLCLCLSVGLCLSVSLCLFLSFSVSACMSVSVCLSVCLLFPKGSYSTKPWHIFYHSRSRFALCLAWRPKKKKKKKKIGFGSSEVLTLPADSQRSESFFPPYFPGLGFMVFQTYTECTTIDCFLLALFVSLHFKLH